MHDSVQKYKDILSAIDRKIEEQKINSPFIKCSGDNLCP